MKGPNIPQTPCLLSLELAFRAPLKQAKQEEIGGGKQKKQKVLIINDLVENY